MTTELVGKICEACREEFSCGANAANCWCFSESIDSKTLAKLADGFKNCLCPDCLTKKSIPIEEVII